MVQQLKNDFYVEMYGFVKKHSAINNEFIDRFARGDISVSEFIPIPAGPVAFDASLYAAIV